MDQQQQQSQQRAEMTVTLSNAVALVAETFKNCTGENVSDQCGDVCLSGDILHEQIAVLLSGHFSYMLK